MVFFFGLGRFLNLLGHGTFSSLFFDKRPLNVGRHVLNVFYLKDFMTWQVCEMLSDISLGGVFLRCLLCNYHVGAPCSVDFKIKYMASGIETRTFGRHVLWLIVKYMDLLKPVGFSKTHSLGAIVLINLKLIDMAFGCDVRWFMIESPVGRHVQWLKIVVMACVWSRVQHTIGRHVLNVMA